MITTVHKAREMMINWAEQAVYAKYKKEWDELDLDIREAAGNGRSIAQIDKNNALDDDGLCAFVVTLRAAGYNVQSANNGFFVSWELQ